MATRWLKRVSDGFIFSWDPVTAAEPGFIEVTEEQAHPEDFMPEAQKGRKTKLKLDTDEGKPPPSKHDKKLGKEAARGFPKDPAGVSPADKGFTDPQPPQDPRKMQ